MFCCQTKKCRTLVSLSLIVLIASLLFATQIEQKEQIPQKQLRINNQVFLIEIADTPKSRSQGLSDRESIASDESMLFVFPEPGLYGFWMKDMNFPIDIVWLSEDFRITHIEREVSPESFPKSFISNDVSQYVLEFDTGVSDTLGLQEGDIIEISKVL